MKKIYIFLVFLYTLFNLAFVNAETESSIIFTNIKRDEISQDTPESPMRLPQIINLPGENVITEGEKKEKKFRQSKSKLRPKILEDSVKPPIEVNDYDEDEEFDDEEIAKVKLIFLKVKCEFNKKI